MRNRKTIPVILAFGMIIFSILACSFGGNTAEKPTTPPEPQKKEVTSPTDNPGKVETTIAGPVEAPKTESKFPLPDKAKIIQSTDAMVIASVNMTMKDVIAFYRADAKARGLTEYELLTTITDNVFSMAFRVPGQEEELVIQGTVIAADNLTLSLRYEETDVK